MKRVWWIGLAVGLGAGFPGGDLIAQSGDPAKAEGVEPAASPVPPGVFPAQLVARRVSEALLDPRNAVLWDRVDRAAASLGSVDEEPPARALVRLDRPQGAVAPTSGKDRSGALAPGLWERVRVSSAALLSAAAELRSNVGIDSETNLAVLPWMIAAVLMGLLVLVWTLRSALRRIGLSGPTGGRAVRAAHKLTRRGVEPAEVARRTGLPREAIQLMKRLRTDSPGRRAGNGREVA